MPPGGKKPSAGGSGSGGSSSFEEEDEADVPSPDTAASPASEEESRDRHRSRERRKTTEVKPESSKGCAPEEKPAAKGKGRDGSRKTCAHCGKSINSCAAAEAQHLFWNAACLQWQIYNRGGKSWSEAGKAAHRLRQKRMDAYEQPPRLEESGQKSRDSAGSKERKSRDATRADPGASAETKRRCKNKHKTDKEEHKGKGDKTEKTNKDKKHKKTKRDRAKSPTPEVKRERPSSRKSPPSGSESDNPRGFKITRTGDKTFTVCLA